MKSSRGPESGAPIAGINWIFPILMVIASGLGIWGWYRHESTPTEPGSWWLAVYLTVQTFFLEVEFDDNPAFPLNVVAFLAPASLAGSILINVLQFTRLRVLARLIQCRSKDHLVIIGDSPTSRAFVEAHNLEHPVVYLVGPEADVPTEIKNLPAVRVLPGEYAQMIPRARIDRARATLVFPPTPDALEEFAREIVTAYPYSGGEPLRASFSIGSGAIHDVFSEFSLVLSDTYASRPGHCVFNAFALGDRLARSLAERVAPHHTLSREVVLSQEILLLVHGFGPLVERFILEAAHLYHYSPHHTVRIAVFSDDIAGFDRFRTRNAGLSEVISLCQYTEQELVRWVRGTPAIDDSVRPYHVVVFPDEGWDIPRLARSWRRILVQSFGDASMRIPITCVIPFEEPLTEIYRALETSLDPIGVRILSLRQLLNFKLLIENTEDIDGIARHIHERYSEAFGDAPWDALSDWKKDFNRRSAAHLKIKLWLLGFELREDISLPKVAIPEISPEDGRLLAQIEHRRWMAEKLLDDFVPGQFPEEPAQKRVYKDHLRIHQDIRPFHELSALDVMKDELTFTELEAILSRVLKRQRLVRLDA